MDGLVLNEILSRLLDDDDDKEELWSKIKLETGGGVGVDSLGEGKGGSLELDERILDDECLDLYDLWGGIRTDLEVLEWPSELVPVDLLLFDLDLGDEDDLAPGSGDLPCSDLCLSLLLCTPVGCENVFLSDGFHMEPSSGADLREWVCGRMVKQTRRKKKNKQTNYLTEQGKHASSFDSIN